MLIYINKSVKEKRKLFLTIVFQSANAEEKREIENHH